VAQGVPLLGVCRGFQEINVALGGSLHQQVHDVPGRMDHREPKGAPFEEQYAPSHPIHLAPGSVLAHWAGGPDGDGQFLARPGCQPPGRRAATPLAHAPDGQIEAFEVLGARTFAYAVQFHPEWRCWDNPFYGAIFNAFGDAVRARRADRLGLPLTA
jgi:putative glutamine amidotransferase